MAKVFLDEKENYSVSNGSEVFGNIGSETLRIAESSTNNRVHSTIERIEFTGDLATYSFGITGNLVTVKSGTTTVATITVPDTAAGQTLAFADGSAALKITGLNQATLGGIAVPTTSAPIVAPVDHNDTSGDLGAVNTFTLKESVLPGVTGTPAVTAVYWGYNPHNEHLTTDGGVEIPTTGIPADGGIPVADLISFLTTITGLDIKKLGLIDANGVDPFQNVTSLSLSNPLTSGANNTTSTAGGSAGSDSSNTLTINFADGSFLNAEVGLGAQYFSFLNNLLFDKNGNTRLYEQIITPEGSGTEDKLQPIVLTPTVNNGGTLESGFTTAGDDVIVAGRLELLHGAYIDGGAGYNILEIEAKGTYAQPLQLLKIQEVRVNDLPNLYTTNDLTTNAYLDTPGSYLENSTYPLISNDGSDDSWIDLNRATSIERLVVTDQGSGSGTADGSENDTNYSGDLTIVGVRNAATLRLEGGFNSGATTIQYGQGQTGSLNVELALGDVTKDINILQNAAVLKIDSQGEVNHMHSFFAGGSVSRMYVKGTGEFSVNENLASSFNVNAPILIDASANTGGLNIDFESVSENDRYASVTVKGTAVNDSIFVKGIQGYTPDQIAANNGATTLTNGKVTIDAGNGDNSVVTDGSSIVKVTTGTGDDTIFTKDAQIATIVAGDGANVINADDSVIVTITSGAGDDNISAQDGETITINAAAGSNIINTDSSTHVSITTGDGSDTISSIGSETVVIDAAAGNNKIAVEASVSVSISTGAGNDTITAVGNDITINSGGGTDTITLSGTYGDEGVAAGDGALLTINTGATGSATIYLGNDVNNEEWNDNLPGVTALDGSVISGNNVKFYVDSRSNLTNADITGLTGATKVVLESGDTLRITADQFKQIGAAAFSEHLSGAGYQVGDVYILLEAGKSFDLSSVTDLTSLSPNVKLHFELQEAANLTLTATQLHNYLANDAITSVTGTNGATATSPNGIVTLKGVGTSFDIANDGDTTRIFGTITEAKVDNLVITRGSSATDFNRPSDVVTTDKYIIDSTGDAPLVITKSITTIAPTLSIIGTQNIDMTGAPVKLGNAASQTNDFTIDFSKLTGTLTGLTVKDFSDVKSVTGNNTNTRINVELTGYPVDASGDSAAIVADANVGAAGNTKGLTTSGVAQYVVTSIDLDGDGNINEGESATFYLCDTSKDIKVLGLHGNGGNTLTFAQVPWGKVAPTILLEGDGYADWNGGLKSDIDPNQSNIGTVIVKFDALQGTEAPAIVNINNGGVPLGVTSTGTPRPFYVDGIELFNATSLQLNVTEGNAIINDINVDADGASAVELKSLDLNATGSLEIEKTLPSHLEMIDAVGVTGSFTAGMGDMTGQAFTFLGGAGEVNLTLHAFTAEPGTIINGGAGDSTLLIADGEDVDLSAAALTSIEHLVLLDGGNVTLTLPQVVAIGAANITLGPDATAAVISIANVGEEAFAAPSLNDGITLGAITIVAQDVVTLNASTNLSGATKILVHEGTTLNLTAAQFQQLKGVGTIEGIDDNGDGNSAQFTVNITDLKQADIDKGFSIAPVYVAGVLTSGIPSAAQGTITLAESVVLATDTNLGVVTTDVDGNPVGFAIKLATGQIITLSNDDQANIRVIGVAEGATGTTVKFALTYGDVDTTVTIQGVTWHHAIDTTNYNGITTLQVWDKLIEGQNVELVLAHLSDTIVVDVITAPVDVVDPTHRIVVVESGVTIDGNLVFEDLYIDREVATLDLTLKGGVEINGDIDISLLVNGIDADGFKKLTINSDGATANLIDGQLMGVSNNFLNVEVKATQDLSVDGIVFTADETTTTNHETAHLTVSGSGNVVIGDKVDGHGINTADNNVDSLISTHTGTGSLTLRLVGSDLDQVVTTDPTTTNNDHLTITGSATGTDTLVISGNVNLSDDVLSSIDEVILENASELTLSQAEFTAIGVANIVTETLTTGHTDPVLNIVGLDTTLFNATALDVNINLGTITIADVPAVTLDPTTNLTGADKIIILDGTVLTMTAAQFMMLGTDADGNGVYESFAPITGDGTLNITGLTQAQVDAGFDVANVAAYNGSITLADATVVLDNATDLNSFSLILADNQKIAFLTDAQANEREITAGTNTTVELGFTLADVGTTVLFKNGPVPVAALHGFNEALVDYNNHLTDPSAATALVNAYKALTTADGVAYPQYLTVALITDAANLAAINASLTGDFISATGINTFHYSGVDTLIARNDLVQGTNVEQILANLESGTTVDIITPAESINPGAATHDRVVVVEPDVIVGQAVGESLIFEDLNNNVEVKTLDLTLKGNVEIQGAINITQTNGFAADVQGNYFQSMAIHSNGDGTAADNNVMGAIHAGINGAGDENNLLNITINGAQDLSVGAITFTSKNDGVVSTVTDSTATARLTLAGSTDVTIAELNTDDPDVVTLDIANTGTGLLTVTGASPALQLNATETLNLSGPGSMTFGLAATLADVGNAGLSSDSLSLVNASAMSGTLNMGIIANVDSTDFTFTAGTGVTSLILGADPDAPGTHPILDADKTVVATPTVNAEPGWVIDLTNAAAASTVTITDAVVFTDGDLAVILDNTGTLVFDGDVNFGNAGTGFTPATGQTAGIDNVSITGNAGVGGNIRVTADSSVDFSSLQHLVPVAGAVPAHLVSDLTLTGIDGIALDAGALVRMTDAQFAAQALTFSGAGQTLVISQEIFDKIDLLDGVNDNAADLTQLRGITAIQIDDAVVTGTLLMTPAEAAVATAVTETAGAYATQTWDHDSDVTTAKVDRVAGDFRGIDALINIQVAHAADISALRGVDQIDVIDATPASLKISAEQVTPLGDGNETSYANEVAALSSLSISITYQQGIDSDTGVPLPVFNTRDVVMTVSHDATTGDVTTIATTGHVAAVGRAQTDIGANFDTLMALSDTVNLTFVGSFASTLVNTAGTPDINLYAGVVETLSFVQTPYLSDWTLLDSATEIHGFLATSTAGAALDDKLGLNQTFTSAATATGAVAVVADVTAAAANANGTVYALDALINTSATDLVTIDAAVLTNIDNANLASSFDGTELLKALVDLGVGNTASGIQVDTQGDSFYLAVTQGAFSYLYMVDSNHDTTGGANNGVAAANEIALIAVFDTNIDLIGASKTIIVDI